MMQAIAAVLAAFYFISVARLHQRLKLDFKPFSCGLCLSVWVALLLLVLPDYITVGVLTCFGAGVAYPLFSRLYTWTLDRML